MKLRKQAQGQLEGLLKMKNLPEVVILKQKLRYI